MDGLVQLLAGDAAFYGDGGSKGAGVPRPVFGREKVVKLLLALFKRGERLGGSIEPVHVNGQPGAKLLDADGRLISVFSLEIADGAIRTIRSVINPDKLVHLGALSPIGRRPSADRSR
jgi:RNA polymerase sigma-70 factor (ECF subfamily)